MNETPKSKRGWRILRRILITLAVLATLAAAFYAEEDWRGKHDWESYKHKWEAKGEKFDWQAFVPAAVPDDQNFFTAPIFTNLLNGKIAMSPYGADGGPDFHPDASRSGYAVYRMQMTDLKMWQKYYRNPTKLRAVDEFVMTNGALLEHTNHLNHPAAEFSITSKPQTPAKDVLFALSKFDSAVEELRQASQRPYANVPLNYEDGFNTGSTLLPYLATLKRCTQLLQLRASAELAADQATNALDDVKLALYLNNSLRSSPFLISYLVRIAIVPIDIQPIWEGLAEHEWSDEQLVALEAELAKVDFLANYGFIMRGERAFGIQSFEHQRITRQYTTWDNALRTNIVHNYYFMPSAFFYQNELALARAYQQWLLPLVDTNSGVILPAAVKQVNAAVGKKFKHYSPYTVETKMLIPALSFTAAKIASIQATIDLAKVACALERYRLAHDNYPETLDALTPQFIAKLPHDIIGGQPLHYRLESNGQFILYSIGWDGKDDGGVESKRSRDEGDWVWQYPPERTGNIKQ